MVSSSNDAMGSEHNKEITLSGNRALEKSALFVATLSSFMAPFMISSVNVALPLIQSEFSADAVMLSWIATAYLLAVAMFLVPWRLGNLSSARDTR